ncbi:hypothetical protein NKH77_54085 [Streptomyces sp. M19]
MPETVAHDQTSRDAHATVETLVHSPSFKAAAPSEYARLRALGPLHRIRLSSGMDAWLVVDFALARQVLTHPAILKDPTPAAEVIKAAGYTLNRPGVGLGGNLLEADPPEHGRLRRLIAAAFTARRTATLAPRVQRIADDLIDAMGPRGEADLVESFTGRCRSPSSPNSSASRTGTARTSAPGPPTPSTSSPGPPRVRRPTQRPAQGVGRGEAAQPQDDLISALVAVRDEDDGRLSEEELIGTAVLWWSPGTRPRSTS